MKAQGKAKRRQPRSAALGTHDHNNKPWRGGTAHTITASLVSPLQGCNAGRSAYPGRRCALPWA